MDPKVISSAIIVFVGKGLSPFPIPSRNRVLEVFGPALGPDLNKVIDALSDEFYEVEPLPDETVIEATERATSTFVSHHPEISEDAVKALRWSYSYDWK